jgi:DNA-binding NarL/FixJ family response regulator
LAEDFIPFRAWTRSLLDQCPSLRVVGEVSDGLAAVVKAQELKPDLILMDIGLPQLHGLEAARRIRNLAPSSKIVFLSQENDADLVNGRLQ